MPLSPARDTPNAEVREDEDGRQSGWMKTALLALYLRLLSPHPLPVAGGLRPAARGCLIREDVTSIQCRCLCWWSDGWYTNGDGNVQRYNGAFIGNDDGDEDEDGDGDDDDDDDDGDGDGDGYCFMAACPSIVSTVEC